MNEQVAIAALSLAGTLLGSLGGVLASSRLTTYRLQELEKKVDKHNHVIERTAILERDLKTAFRLIDEMREEMNR